jgi:hypothetical protein
MPPIAAVIANFLSDELADDMLPFPLPVLLFPFPFVFEFVFCAVAVEANIATHINAALSMKPSFLPFPMFVLPLFVIRL